MRQYTTEARSLAEHAPTKRSEIENQWNGTLGIISAIWARVPVRGLILHACVKPHRLSTVALFLPSIFSALPDAGRAFRLTKYISVRRPSSRSTSFSSVTRSADRRPFSFSRAGACYQGELVGSWGSCARWAAFAAIFARRSEFTE